MIDGLKPYPAMKDSGVPWLGDVPKHWEVLPAKAVYRPKQVKNVGMIESTVLSLSYGRIVVKPTDKLHGLVPESFEGYQIVVPGNIIVRTTDLQNDRTSLRIGHSHHRGIITAAYLCLETSNQVVNEFGYQFLNVFDLLKGIYGYGSGLRQSLDFRHIARMPVTVPPRAEQFAILRFLHHVDGRIRRYIAAKQKLIKLLEEEKQVIIHRAVTRGLDPRVNLKPSGVDWMGDVPDHWQVRPLKFLVPQVTVGIVIQPAQLYVESGVPALRSLNISGGAVNTKSLVYISQESNAAHRKSQIFRDDVVIVRTGQAGVAVVVPKEFDGANCIDLLIVRQTKGVVSEYLATYINSWAAKTDVAFKSVGAIQAHYNTATLANLIVPLPPVKEQEAILRDLKRQLGSLDGAARKPDAEIDLLREYRTRLIADVVTGKLDVREAAAKLPDVAEEPSALDETENMLTAEELDAEAQEEAA